MKIPLILQDINSKVLPKNIVVTSPTFFIKSFGRFGIKIQDDYVIDFLGGQLIKVEDQDKIFDIPYIYSVIPVQNENVVKKEREFIGVNSNFSYTLFLGKTEKKIKLEIINNFNDVNIQSSEILVIHYKPNNVTLESQEHYDSLLINNDLPTLKELLPAIIKEENEYDLIRKLLLDFKEIKKHRGKLKGIEKFLNFIGFDPDSIKLYPEYTTPTGNRTINPNKKTDFKNGFYHVLYDNWIINDNDRYTKKNLPKAIIQINDISGLFDKLYYALVLANDYFTIPEQQMSFFGMSNSVNSEQFLSVTSNMTATYFVDTLSNLKSFNINIYNRTIQDSNPLYIIKNKKQKTDNIKLSEVKIYTGYYESQKQNNFIYQIEKELSDNTSDTDLTDEEEMKLEYLFGNVLNIELVSLYNKVRYTIKNVSNGLIQFVSKEIPLVNNLLQQKIFIGSYGSYELLFTSSDYYGNKEEYKYLININEANIDFEIFNSTKINEISNSIAQDVDSPIKVQNELDELNLSLTNSGTNMLLTPDLLNYFDIVKNENHRNLLGNKQFNMKLMNKNIAMRDVTETLPLKYVDNFLNVISLKKIDGCEYEFSDNLFTKLLDISIDNITFEQHWFITTKTNSVNINKYLHTINIIDSNGIEEIIIGIETIIKNKLNSQFEFRTVNIPVNYDFDLYQDLDSIDQSNYPFPSVAPIIINSVYPRLHNISIDEINSNDDSYSLKLGDIILCRIDSRYIVNATDIKWSVFNSFNNELLFETNDFALKYRVLEKALYNIKLTLMINNEQYVINKKEIQTSFTI